MRMIALLGLAAAICLGTPALAQEPGREAVNARDASVTFAGRQGLEAGVVLRERADAWRQQGELEQAIVEYSRALETSPGDPDSLYGRGKSYHLAGNIGKAIDDYSAAVRMRPRWVEVYKMRAHARFAQGSPDLAIADLRRAIEYDPKDVDHLSALGVLRLSLGESDVARSNLIRALQFKDDPETMLLLYIARAQGGERTTQELEAGSRRLRAKVWPFPLVELYLGKRSVGDALAAAHSSEERCEAQYYIGQLHLLQRSKAEAQAAFRQAALVCPKTHLEYGAATAELKRLR